MTRHPHLTTPFHTSTAQVWSPASTTTTTPSYRGVGVWCGACGITAVSIATPHHFHTRRTNS